MVFGAAIGLALFSYLVPSGPKMIGMYRSSRLSKMAEYNQNTIQDMGTTIASTTGLTTVSNKTLTTCSGYATPKITSEKQFLQLMKSHHETDILMATQMVLLPTMHPETKTLAKNIINEQNTELKMLRDWLAAWK